MNPNEKDRYTDRDFFEGIFEKIFESMRKMYRNDNIETFVIDTNDDISRPNRNFVQNVDANIAPHKKFNVTEFKNDRPMALGEISGNSENSGLSTDIIDTDRELSVTINIPVAEKKYIHLNVADDSLEININTPKVRYHKIHKLPCSVKPKLTIASYKNGVLDIVMKRKEKKNTERKYKANID